MKILLKYLFLSLALHTVLPAEDTGQNITLGTDYTIESKVDHEKLIGLAMLDKRDFEQNRRLWQMIIHAGIEKDTRFKELLGDKVLRASHPSVDNAISAYDYMLSKNEQSLDHILAFLATEPVGADTDTIIILSAINEWDRSIRAFKKHFYRVDGAGGANYSGFLETRRILYPALYAKHRQEIEASPRELRLRDE